MTIITYGGGEILAKIFQSISLLFYGQGEGLIRALMILTASIGGFWAFSQAFFRHSGEALLIRFFFPLLILVHLLLLPQTTVRIEDVTVLKSGDPTKKASITVDRVPFLLGKLASLVSTYGYKITQAVETVMHVPEDVSYNKTGHIFGAENLLEASSYRIRDADLENNFRNFVHQCVFYDLALGKYSIDELKKSTDLWEFFSKNTSKVRGIMYCPPKEKSTDIIKKCAFCSCKEAIAKMTPLFEQEKNFYVNNEVYGRLPLSYQALTGLQNEAQNLISQQLVMNTVTEDLQGGSSSFAKSRAYTKQRETFHVLGSLTAKSLITMRNVLEALIYASFIFIAPIALLPNGFRFITTWAGLVIWIQLWPPFFSMLNYMMQVIAHSKAESLFGPGVGLSFFSSVGLRDLYSDMHAVAGYLAASIPFITYALLKGGVGSFVQLASSIMAPAHTAATSSAEEKVSGNYSLGNVNWGNMQSFNASSFKRHLAPGISSGFFTEDSGQGGVTYSHNGEVFYKQGKSDLRTSIQKSDTFSTALQEAHQTAQSHVDTETANFAKGLNHYSNSSASLVEHFSRNYQAQEGTSDQIGQTDQQAIHAMGNLAEKFGERFGMDRRQSMEILAAASASAGGGLNLFGLVKANTDLSSKFSASQGASSSEVIDAAKEFVQTEQFQEHWQRFENSTQQFQKQNNADEGARFHEDVQTSWQSLASSQESLQKALSHMEQISATLSWTKSSNLGVQQALDHAFIQWAAKERGFAKTREILDQQDTDPEKIELMEAFLRTPENWASINPGSSTRILPKPDTLKDSYRNKELPTPSLDQHLKDKEQLLQRAIEKTQINPGDIHRDVLSANEKRAQDLTGGTQAYTAAKAVIIEKGRAIDPSVKAELETNTFSRTLSGPDKSKWKEKIKTEISPLHKKFDYEELFKTLGFKKGEE